MQQHSQIFTELVQDARTRIQEVDIEQVCSMNGGFRGWVAAGLAIIK